MNQQSEEEVMICLKKVKGQNFSVKKNLISDGWLDSYELLQFVKELETSFHKRILLATVSPENFDDIGEILEWIKKIP